MKKLLILILALVMCLSMLTGCDQIKGFIDGIIGGGEDEIEYKIENARNFLNNMYKNDPETTAKDYEVVGQVRVAGVPYTVTWAVDTDKVTIEGPNTKEDGSIVYKVNVDEESATELPYVLTATITAGNGDTATVSFNRVVPEKNLFVSVGNPEEGVAYKFFMIQVSEGNKILYADGTTQSNQDKYLNATQVGTDAPDFFVEKSGEGFKFYYVKDGTNMYIKAYLTTTDHVKYSKCLMYTNNAAEGTVWTYHADTNSWHTDLVQDTLEGDKTVNYVIGTYGTYLTFSISEATYITPDNTGVSQFPGGLLPKAVAEVDNSTPEERIQATIDAIKLPELVSDDGVVALPTAGERYPDVTISWASNADYAVVGENGVTVTLQDTEKTVTLTATLTLGDVTKTHEFTLNLASSLVMNENHPYGTYIYQAKINGGAVLYLDGGVSGRYLTTTTDATKGVSVYAEKATGGYKLYILDGETKMYINIYNNADGKTSVNYAAESETVYSYNKSVNAWTTVFGGKEVYLGTYNTFDTVSVSDLSYITAENTGVSQFPLDLHAATLEHVCSFEDVVVEATCTVAGSVTPTCACGKVDEENVEVLPALHAISGVCAKCDLVIVNVSDLADGKTTDAELVEGTGVTAFAGLTIEDNGKEIDGFVFTNRLKLGGSMKLEGEAVKNSIKIVTDGAATITVYAISGSGTETRTLRLCTLADGALVDVMVDETVAGDAIGKYVFTVEAAGTYYLGSKSSGINLYYIAVADVKEVVAGEQTASKTIADLIASEGWTSSTTKQEFNLDDNVTVKVDGGSNSGKAYNNDHIRIYATDTPAGTLTISVAEGYELVSIKITTQTGTYAFLYLGDGTTDICNTEVEVSGSSVVLNSVKNGSDGKQVRVMAIEVVYQAAN